MKGCSVNSQRLFTLIELLVVMVILMVLMTLVFPLLRIARESARGVLCISNLKQCGLALYGYAIDHNEAFPPPEFTSIAGGGYDVAGRQWGWNLVRSGYLPTPVRRNAGPAVAEIYNDSILLCPSLPTSSSFTGTTHGGSISYSGPNTTTTYGMRSALKNFPLSLGNPQRERWFMMDGSDPASQPGGVAWVGNYTKMTTVALHIPFLADTAIDGGPVDGSPNYQFYKFITRLYIGVHNAMIHRRHVGKKANLWFPDGRVATLNRRDIESLDPDAPHCVTSFYYLAPD